MKIRILVIFFILILLSTVALYVFKQLKGVELPIGVPEEYITYVTKSSPNLVKYDVKDEVQLNDTFKLGLGQSTKLKNVDLKITLEKIMTIECDAAMQATGTDYCDWGYNRGINITMYKGKKYTDLMKRNEYVPYTINEVSSDGRTYVEYVIRDREYYCKKYTYEKKFSDADDCWFDLATRYKKIEFCQNVVNEDRKYACESNAK